MLQPPDQGGQSGRQALLPESVELMLLRSAQMRINQRTADLSADSAASPEAAAELARLAARQQRLVEIARQMNERK
jgi:ABC-type sugar transport system ATPase subunit